MGRRRRGEEPQMRFHADSGQARVRINGKTIYLGKWDSAEAKANYHRLLVEWHGQQANGTTRPILPSPQPQPAASAPALPPPPTGLTIAELCLLWIAACEKKFTRKDGRTSSTIHECRMIARALEPDGLTPAATFRARALATVQERLVAEGRPRTTVNRLVKGKIGRAHV